MYVLLSSAANLRYKQDVLRCLAAPLGASVQFRYAKRYLTKQVLDQLHAHRSSKDDFGDGLVCFVDSGKPGLSPLIPVRKVVIEKVFEHGTTISVSLRMREFAHADPATFTPAVVAAVGNITPMATENGRTGSYFFSLPQGVAPTSLGGLSFSSTLELWESIVEQLQRQPAFADEHFFWTVLGTANASIDEPQPESFREWSRDLSADHGQFLLIYHYRPQGGDIPQSTLAIQAGGPVLGGSPELIEIDSRYDLKRWLFSTGPADLFPRHGWLRIRTNGQWNLDLPATLPGSYMWRTWATVAVGVFIAMPAIVNAIGRHNDVIFSLGGRPYWSLIIEVIVSLAAGLVAGTLVMLFGPVPRIRS